MGLSSSMTARFEDLSAIFYNPAGLGYVEQTEWNCGLTAIKARHSFKNSSSSQKSEKKFFPYYLYAAHRFTKKIVIGFGIYTPFGLGTVWGKSWNGRYTSTSGELSTVFFNPAITYRLNNMVILGCGISYITSSAKIETAIDSGLQLFTYGFVDSTRIASPTLDSSFSMKGNGSGISFSIGALVQPREKFRLGVSYRMATDINYKGKANFNHADSPYATLLGIIMPASQKGQIALHLPWILNVGGYYKMSGVWDVSLDLHYMGWSVLDRMIIDLAQDMPYDEISINRKWKNSSSVRFGSTYRLKETLILRTGIFYEKTPVPDETFEALVPDTNRLGLTMGVGYTIGTIRFDASCLIVKLCARNKNNEVGFQDMNGDGITNIEDKKILDVLTGGYATSNGTYTSTENLISLSLSYSFSL